MVRDTGKHPSPSPEALFSATQAPVPNSRLFWMRLLSRRPLVLLGSLWLVTVCVAAVASHRLLFADPGRSAGVALSPAQAPTLTAPLGAGDGANEAATARSRRNIKVTLWGLSSLVGLCALGSVVISQRAKAVARRKPQRRVRRVKPKAKAKTPTGPKRLQPYSPQRDAVIVKGAVAVADTLPLTVDEANIASVVEIQAGAEAVVTPVAPPAPQRRDARETARPPMAPQSGVAKVDAATKTEVVPPDEAHPLDWTEDSLAHALDLRQRRSLSSLM